MILGRKHDDDIGAGLESPCVDVCKMDRNDELCLGCHRTLDEIVRWSKASDDEKREILAAVARRRDQLDPGAELGSNRRD